MTQTRFLRRRLLALSVLICLGIFFMPAQVAAQAAVGAPLGNVTDESGGAVPGASITATEVRTNISRTAVTNAAGNYTFTNLPSGLYRVEGELVGFRKFSRDNVEVSVNTTLRVDIPLTVGELEESVTVTGEAPMLQTDRTDTGRIIESTQITQLPLGFNRNFRARWRSCRAPASSTDTRAQNGYANAMAAFPFLLDVPFSIERGVVNVSDVFRPLDELHRGGRHKSVFSYVHDK